MLKLVKIIMICREKSEQCEDNGRWKFIKKKSV